MTMSEQALQEMNAKLDRMERLTMIGAKEVLDLDEAVMFTRLSKGHLYRLTSERKIPHYKKCRKLYFNKKELAEWLLAERVDTTSDISSQAATYVATHR